MKLTITPELTKLLKGARVHSGISSKQVAQHLGKTPSYVSKLENCGVQTIDKDQLASLLLFVMGGEELYADALPLVAGFLLNTLDKESIARQAWFMQYDVIERPVAVSAAIRSDIASNLEKLQLDAGRLAAHINLNIDAGTSETFPTNQMVAVKVHENVRLLAHAKVEESEIAGIVAGTREATTYYTLYNVAYSLLRLQNYPDEQEKLPPEKAAAILRGAASWMDCWNVHSLIGFAHFLSSDEFISYQTPLASAKPGVVEDIAEMLGELMEHDSLTAVNQLNAFCDTLAWDPSFALKLLGLPFSSLGDLSFSNKQQLLQEISQLIERYDSMDGLSRRMERY